MPMTVSELQVKVSADTGAAEQGLSALGSKVGSAGTAIATAFGGAAIAGIAGLTAGLAASVATAATFEAKMSAISAVSGATASEMDALREKALQLGADTSFSASEAAEGINELIKAGVSVGDVIGGGAAAALSLAAAGGLSVAESAEIASNAMNVFSLKGADVGHVADVIAGAANASAIDVHDFGMSLAASGAVAATVGIGFDDLGTAIAVMGQAGIKGSDAGTSLKTMLLNLTPATDKQLAVAKELGIVTADGANKFFDAEGKAKSLADISGVLQKATAGLTEQQKLQALQTLFGTDAIRAAAIMAKAGSEGFTEMATSIGKVTAEAVAAERLNNLKGDVEQLTGSLETAGIKIGTAFLPGLRSIVQGSTEIVNQAAPVLEQFAKDSASAIQEASRQIQDAWRTAKQAFAGEWLPSKDIPPFVNAVGQAATKVGELARMVSEAADKAGRMGAWDNLNNGLGILSGAAQTGSDRLNDIADALERLRGPSNQAASATDILAAAIKGAALGWQYATLQVEGFVDQVGSSVAIVIDFATAASRTGEALQQLQRGDLPGAIESLGEARVAFSSGVEAAEGFRQRGLDRVADGARIMADLVSTHMTASTAAVESNMSAAQARVAEGSAGMQQFMEANMIGVVAAVETNGAAAVAASEQMGVGMAAGIQSAAPQMEAAASQGASGAVAAVEGQTGAASAAGQSLGSALGSGLEGGILAYAGRVASAAARLLQGAIAAATGPQGADAQSPSKKTIKLGKDLAEGLEIGLNSSNMGAEMQAKIRDFIAASREYIPVAGQIARVEAEIKTIRDQGQTDALFRAQEMITLDSESLRLKENITRLDRDSIGFRQDLARATREIADAERGTLAERTATIEIDAKRKAIRLETLDLEKQLLTVHKNSDRTEFIKRQIEALRDQDRLLGIEAERITTTNSLATTAARVRREQIDDQVRGYDAIIQTIKNQIDILGAERGVFDANEAVIKNATANEIAYRERLIAVFKSEATPLTDRIAAGLKLIDQLEKEGRISKDLAGELRGVATEAGKGAAASQGLGSAVQGATPQLDSGADQADQMAMKAAAIAQAAANAAEQMRRLGEAASKLPSLVNPSFHFGFASGGRPPVGMASLVGERGPELFVPDRQGTIIPADVTRSWMNSGGGSAGPPQVIRLDVAIGGQVAKQIVIEGYDLAVRRGWTPGGLTG